MPTEWIDLPADDLNANRLAQIVTNFAISAERAVDGDVLPVPTVAGGPAVGWLTALRIHAGTLQGRVRWLDGDAFRVSELIVADHIDPTTAQPRGFTLLEAVATQAVTARDDVFDRLLARHAADLHDHHPNNEQDTCMNPQTIIHNAALNVAKRDGIPLDEATRRVRAAAQRPIGAPVQRGGNAATGACVPPMPVAGQVTDVRSARLHLSTHHPAWERMSNDEQHLAAMRLRDLCTDAALGAQLSGIRGQTIATCLFAGSTPHQRLRAYLSATEASFDQLTHEQQHARIIAARGQFNVIDGVA